MKKKKMIGFIFLAAMLVSGSGGCGKPEEEQPEGQNTEQFSDTEQVSDILIDTSSWGKDNSLDVYSAAVSVPLRDEMPGRMGVSVTFLGTDRGYHFTHHSTDKIWDQLNYVTADEESGFWSFEKLDRMWGIGPVAGTDHYICFHCKTMEDEGELRYFLKERDENNEVVREIALDFLTSPADKLITATYLAADSSGMIHMVYTAEGEGQQYLLLSPEGEVLFSKSSNTTGLIPLYDGRIAFVEFNWDDKEKCNRTDLLCLDKETGKAELLASLTQYVGYLTLLDENTALYADSKGVYRSGLSGENQEPLYLWLNHGIALGSWGIYAMQADQKGDISLIYDDSEDIMNYLCLTPTTEEVETLSITLGAVGNGYGDDYKAVVTAFNKRYPRWHIEIKNDYDATALLTQLGAGSGPVLVETGLVGFEELEKLWEPLDSVLEQLNITEELVPSVMDMGKINGVQYGIMTDFSLETTATGNQDLKEWDYETFLQCLADSPNAETFFDIYWGGNYGTVFIMNYFCNGIDDAYFWDAEAGTTNFDSTEFRRALELAKKYCTPKEEVVMDRTMLKEGKVFINHVYINVPEDVAGYRIFYGEDANYIGFPGKDGSAPRICAYSSLAVRKTATKEEKEVAMAFLNFILSYEGQKLAAKDLNYKMSVRRDILEEEIAAMSKGTKVDIGNGTKFKFYLGEQVDVELDRNTLMNWIDTAKPARGLPKELGDILEEELEQYFSDTISEDMLIDHLESRVGLYLNERK